MFSLPPWFRHRGDRPYVRPLPLATPIADLLICLPLFRPLRHPGQAGVDEQLRLLSISAMVEHAGTLDASLGSRLAIPQGLVPRSPHVIRLNSHDYSDQMPMLAFLLSGPY